MPINITPDKSTSAPVVIPTTTKSERSIIDSSQEQGNACTDNLGRAAAAFGLLKGVESQFQISLGVKGGAVLLSVPFLVANGVSHEVKKHFQSTRGYYQVEHVFLILCLMSLSRIKNIEQLRKTLPGEIGKCLGLDRIPSGKTIRRMIKYIASSLLLRTWSASLSAMWLNDDDFSGRLYVDGHVRLYYGYQTTLPRRFCSNHRLCLRSMIDYYVNDEKGNPFFAISSALSGGMTKTIREEIIPRILSELKSCPSELELANDPDLHKFVLIYDRESYGYSFMWEMRQLRIACQTYNKYPKDDWPESDFALMEVKLVYGNIEKMKVAEKEFYKEVVDEQNQKQKLKVREVRVLTESGHQTAIVSTDYKSTSAQIASQMFARWCQENYFKYMTEHFDIDRLTDYSLQEINGTSVVISNAFKLAENLVKKLKRQIDALHKKYGKIAREEALIKEDQKSEENIKKESIFKETELLQKELEEAKANKKTKEKYIQIKDLPEDEKFQQLASPGKHLTDTLKFVSYRAETAMAVMIKQWLPEGQTDTRAILRGFFTSDADIIPDIANSILNIKVHTQSTSALNQILQKLCDELNAENFIFPGTNFIMKYHLLAKQVQIAS